MSTQSWRPHLVPGVTIHGVYGSPPPVAPPYPVLCNLCTGIWPHDVPVETLRQHLKTQHRLKKYRDDAFQREPPRTEELVALALKIAEQGLPVAPAESYYQRDIPWHLPGLYLNGKARKAYQYSTDPVIIRAWWERWPRAAVASLPMRTGGQPA